MSNVTVTILQNGRCDDYGIPLVAGSSCSLDYDRAKSLWQAGVASVADSDVFDDDNTPNNGGFVRYMRFPAFKPLLLASLAANSTASRSSGTVTVSATGHGITTGATYQGFRIYYPGSPSLLAGWYDSIQSVTNANSFTFSAPGPDFLSESINAGAAYTTTTDALSVIIPGGSLKVGSKVSVRLFRLGDTTATNKAGSITFGGTQLGIVNNGSSPFGDVKFGFRVVDSNKQFSVSSVYDAIVGTTLLTATRDVTVDQPLVVRLSCSAASSFNAIAAAHVEIIG